MRGMQPGRRNVVNRFGGRESVQEQQMVPIPVPLRHNYAIPPGEIRVLLTSQYWANMVTVRSAES